MNNVTSKIALEIASHEAIVRQAYKDSVGVWTWSVGMTGATGHDVTRYIDNPAALQQCINVYVWALRNYAHQVNQAFGTFPLTEAQFAAALSFHWNTGAIQRASWVRYVKNGDIDRARANFMLYCRPTSIIGRREKERDLFFYGKWSNNGTMTEYTRLTSRHTPVWKSGRIINVSTEIGMAFAADGRRFENHKPRPNVYASRPTLSPKPVEKATVVGLLGKLFSRWRRK